MGKLKVVVVDRDADYVNCLLDYLMCEHAHRFLVSSFTEEVSLDKFLAKEDKTADLILTSGEFYEKIRSEVQGLIILLDDGEKSLSETKCRAINKYQSGDKLVAVILKIFAEEVSTSYTLNVATQRTKIIGIYSPVGGVGKTTIAVGASIQSVWEGKNVFYLNLENIASTPLYFAGEQEENLANILYYLKTKRKNLSWQIEGAKCVDPLSKIHYFQPPDSIFDFNEDVSGELCSLLRELKATKQYDRLFIDFSCAINKNNVAVLRACDDIILVAQPNMTSVVKIKGMLKELRLLLSGEEEAALVEKFNLVLNKDIAGIAAEVEEIRINEKGICARIPLVEALTSLQGGVYKLDLNSSFGKVIYQLLLNF